MLHVSIVLDPKRSRSAPTSIRTGTRAQAVHGAIHSASLAALNSLQLSENASRLRLTASYRSGRGCLSLFYVVQKKQGRNCSLLYQVPSIQTSRTHVKEEAQPF